MFTLFPFGFTLFLQYEAIGGADAKIGYGTDDLRDNKTAGWRTVASPKYC